MRFFCSWVLLFFMGLFFLRFYLFIYLFIYLEREREGERDGEKRQCVVAYCMPPPEDLAHNPGICPDWESNPPPFASQACAWSTELHKPGLQLGFLEVGIIPILPVFKLYGQTLNLCSHLLCLPQRTSLCSMFFCLCSNQHWTSLGPHCPQHILSLSLSLLLPRQKSQESCLYFFPFQSLPKPENLALLSPNHLPQTIFYWFQWLVFAVHFIWLPGGFRQWDIFSYLIPFFSFTLRHICFLLILLVWLLPSDLKYDTVI